MRVFSGIQPTGQLHLGNLLGAVRNWVTDQDTADSLYCIVDLHALTIPKDPGVVGNSSVELAKVLLGVGLDPEKCTLFLQSHVPQHAQLAWLLQCVTSMGELRRMTQFKDKSDQAEFVSAGLFTYPALQAADILLYDSHQVPVGEDQRQHLELTRDVAERFNHHYGETFVLPAATFPTAAARVMDLQVPTNKMSKSAASDAGTVYITESLDAVAKKFKRAVTDSEGVVRFDPVEKPGVSNLLSILGATTGQDPAVLADQYQQYGPLKSDTADAVVELLRPIQERIQQYDEDPAGVQKILEVGATKATAIATEVYNRAVANIGLHPLTP